MRPRGSANATRTLPSGSEGERGQRTVERLSFGPEAVSQRTMGVAFPVARVEARGKRCFRRG